MSDLETADRLAHLRYQEMLADAERHRQLRLLASPTDTQAVRKPYSLASGFEALGKRLVARFNTY